MLIQEVENKTVWEGFLENVQEKTFLHSWAWGDFQKLLGERVWRFGVYDAKGLVAVVLVIKVKARRGSFLFVPHGPIVKISNFERSEKQGSAPRAGSYFQFPISNEFAISKFQILNELISELKILAKRERCGFIRVSPLMEDNEGNRLIFNQLGFRSAPMHMHAELTWVLDISKEEDELFAGMRKTTRNLIRRGEREGVRVVRGNLAEFYTLYKETEKRQHFVAFSENYLAKELEAFGDNAQIFLAKHEGIILAGAFIVFYGGTTYYHHGASTHSPLPAAYSLQWEIIKEAKKRGMKWYDFWGCVPQSATQHPWWGTSLFKRGFGGHELPRMHAQDLPLSWKYYISWSIERARKWKRGY